MRRFEQLAVKEISEVQELPRVIAMDEYKGDTKELYCHWFKQAKENGQEKIKETQQGLIDFYRKVQQEGSPEFVKAIRTFRSWQTEILNSFLFDYSNGFLEGIKPDKRS